MSRSAVGEGDDSAPALDVTDEDRAAARRVLGLGIEDTGEATEPLREVLRRHQLGWYAVVVLGLLGLADTLQGYAFGVLAPEIGRTLGISRGEIAAVNALKTLASAAMTVPLVMLVQRTPRRALVSIVGAFVWAVFAIGTGFVNGVIGLALVLAIDGATSGTRATMHMPLLADSYPPSVRVRVLSVYTGFGAAGNIVAPLAVALLATVAGLTWRGVFVVTVSSPSSPRCSPCACATPGSATSTPTRSAASGLGPPPATPGLRSRPRRRSASPR